MTTRHLIISTTFFLTISCSNNSVIKNNDIHTDTTADTNSDSLTSKTINPMHSFDTTFISNNRTIIFSAKDINDDSILFNVRCNSLPALYDTILSNGVAYWDFPDINNDGNTDIIYGYIGNIPTTFLFLFDPTTNNFKSVDGFENFPEAIQLKSNPKYYYSYHRAGCADMNWISDFFTIENFKTIHLGQIYGQGCENEDNLRVIEIFKVENNDENKEKLIEKIPYSDDLAADKWDFIDKYWNIHYDRYK